MDKQQMIKKFKAQEILQMVLNELIDRDLLNLEDYEDCFGCKSFDEVAEKIKQKI